MTTQEKWAKIEKKKRVKKMMKNLRKIVNRLRNKRKIK